LTKTLRLGLLIPSSNTTIEHEFNVMRPKEATVHAARMRLKTVTVSKLMDMEREIEAAALKLADAKVNVIGFGCTSGSLVRGLGHDQEIVTRIEKATNIPAVATAGAVVNALKALKVSRISVATPYTEEINSLEKRFLEENGFAIKRVRGLGIKDNLKIGEQTPQTVYNLIKETDTSWNNGIFVSCTNLKTIGVIDRLEEELKKPVISSNTATLWAMLTKIKYIEPLIGWGRLLTML